MAKDCGSFVAACVACQRSGPLRVKSLRGVLKRPSPFQMISLDFVGPRLIGKSTWYYLVIIDHCTRYAVTFCTNDVKAETVKLIIRQCWVSVFGAPRAVLVDRGAAFIGSSFVDYMTKEVCARIVYSSPAYPQGNGINESCHQTLEASIRAVMQYSDRQEVDYISCVRDATIAYNATPHSALGESPYYCLFGFDMCLPGWQHLVQSDTSEVRRQRVLAERRMRDLIRCNLESDKNMQLVESQDLRVGDLCVYHLSAYERGVQVIDGTGIKQTYSVAWSLPCRITEIHDNQVTVQALYGSPVKRKVSRTYVRKLCTDVPESLVRLNAQVVSQQLTTPGHVTGKSSKRRRTGVEATEELDVQGS